MEGLGTDAVLLGLLWYVVFLFSTTLHEASHALVALKLGDTTAYEGGQVTLNPWPHVRREVFGTVVVPLLSFVLTSASWMIGWASAPYDPRWADRWPRRSALMSLAGPVANLSLVTVAAVGIRVGMLAGVLEAPQSIGFTRVTAAVDPAWGGAATMLSILFTLNLLLFLFNLLPVPPLDGSGVVPLVLPEETARSYQRLLWGQPMLSLLGLVIAWKIFGALFSPVFLWAIRLLYPGMGYG